MEVKLLPLQFVLLVTSLVLLLVASDTVRLRNLAFEKEKMKAN